MDFSGYLSDDSGDGSSNDSLVTALISAGASLGTTAILATQAPQTIMPGSYIPGNGNAAPIVSAVQAQQRTSSIIWFAALAIVGVIVFKKL